MINAQIWNIMISGSYKYGKNMKINKTIKTRGE